jgi:phosphatidylethanolamine-binding protein
MSDPDPPDPAKPVFKEWLHWIVANIPGGAEANAAKGTEITPYM